MNSLSTSQLECQHEMSCSQGHKPDQELVQMKLIWENIFFTSAKFVVLFITQLQEPSNNQGKKASWRNTRTVNQLFSVAGSK